MTDLREFRRLTLQVERDLVARDNLRTLLAAADIAIVQRRQDLRTLGARIKRHAATPATSRRSNGQGKT